MVMLAGYKEAMTRYLVGTQKVALEARQRRCCRDGRTPEFTGADSKLSLLTTTAPARLSLKPPNRLTHFHNFVF